jgi:hypothetical protein
VEKVNRRSSIPKVKLAFGVAAALLVALAGTLSVNRYRQPEAAPPEALAHIAEKNREAAVVAAAHQRAESAVSTNAAEHLADAQRQGAAEANATLARFPDQDNRMDAAARRD